MRCCFGILYVACYIILSPFICGPYSSTSLRPFRLVPLGSPEFCYRGGLSAVAEDGAAGGAPTRPLPPTPDDDDTHADRTLVMKRVSTSTTNALHTPHLSKQRPVLFLRQLLAVIFILVQNSAHVNFVFKSLPLL